MVALTQLADDGRTPNEARETAVVERVEWWGLWIVDPDWPGGGRWVNSAEDGPGASLAYRGEKAAIEGAAWQLAYWQIECEPRRLCDPCCGLEPSVN